VALTLATVLLIIAHLDHLAHRLQVGEVVRAVAGEGQEVTGVVLARSAAEAPADPQGAPPPDGQCLVVSAPKDGWVTQAGSADILAAVPPGTTVRLETRTGAYIHAGETLASVWPMPARSGVTMRHLQTMVAVGSVRTMQEDIDIAIRQLVDIGLRALSAAIDDPNTAVEVVLRLGSLLRKLLVAELPPETVCGPGGRILLRPWELNHAEYIDHAFDQLRHLAPAQPQVAAALLRTLRMLIDHTSESGHPEHATALHRHRTMLLEALQGADLHPWDRDRLLALASDATDPADHSRAADIVGDRALTGRITVQPRFGRGDEAVEQQSPRVDDRGGGDTAGPAGNPFPEHRCAPADARGIDGCQSPGAFGGP
jgi:uncharacterized membrane protein